MDRDTDLALRLLRGEDKLIDDARLYAPVGNSLAGSLLSTMYRMPRQYAEAAVRRALAVLEREG